MREITDRLDVARQGLLTPYLEKNARQTKGQHRSVLAWRYAHTHARTHVRSSGGRKEVAYKRVLESELIRVMIVEGMGKSGKEWKSWERVGMERNGSTWKGAGRGDVSPLCGSFCVE
jgi:hypothetical protein